MEQKYFSLRKSSEALKSIRQVLLATVLGLIGTQSGAQQTYTFTNAGATGRLGPTQTQINTAYGSTNLNGMVTSNNGIQLWTVPATGNYHIRVKGASGGSTGGTGGLGADMQGDFMLTGGQVLKIIVGQKGEDGYYYGSADGGGGGGGSFVCDNTNAPLIIAGGGGGKVNPNNTGTPPDNDAFATTTGGHTINNGGGTNGNGGDWGQTNGPAAGGGGLLSDGVSSGSSTGGKAFVNGGEGGTSTGSSYNGGDGGFGGGGGGWHNSLNRCGGGGGYSGGQGGTWSPSQSSMLGHGGGGGSFNSGANQVNVGGVNAGHGVVLITRLCDVNLMASSNPICVGDQVVLSTNAGSGISWSTGASTNSITVSPSSNTSYTVVGTSSSTSACTSTLVITVSVNPLPNVSASGVPSVVCVGSTATLNAYGAGTYSWSNSATDRSTTVAPPATSVYTVTGTDGNGCKNQGTVEVTVNTNSLSITPPVTLCSGSSQSLTASGGAGASSYTWFPQANFPTIIVSPTVTTTYVVAATDIHNCLLTGSVEVTVADGPNIIASVDRDQICRGESVTLSASGGDNYTWSNGLTGPTHNVQLNADVTYTFAVTGSDANGCTGTGTTAVVVGKCTGVDESSAPGRMSISPNPSAGIFQLTFEGKEPRSIRVTDLTGKVIYEKLSAGTETVLDLSGYPGGVYSVQVISASSAITHKLIRE